MRYVFPAIFLFLCQCGAAPKQERAKAPAVSGAKSEDLPPSFQVEKEDTALPPGNDPSKQAEATPDVALHSVFEKAYAVYDRDRDASMPLLREAVSKTKKSPVKMESGALSDYMVSMSKDGRLLLISEDKSACLFDVAGGKPVGFYTRQAAFGLPDILSPTGDALIGVDASSDEKTADLWIRKTARFEETARVKVGGETPVAFLGNDRVAAARPREGETRDELVILSLPFGAVEAVLKTPGPSAKTVEPVASEPSIRLPVKAFVTAPDVIGTIWEDGSVSLHRVSSGHLIGLFEASLLPFGTKKIAFADPTQRAAVSTVKKPSKEDEFPIGRVALVDLTADRTIRLLPNCPYVTDLAFSEDGKVLAVGDLLQVCFFDAKTGRFLRKSGKVREPFGPPDDDLQNVTVSKLDSDLWAAMTGDGALGLLNARTGEVRRLGRAAGIFIAEGDTVVAGIDTDELLVVKKGRVSKRPMTTEESQNPFAMPREVEGTRAYTANAMLRSAENSLCIVDGYLLPSSFCRE